MTTKTFHEHKFIELQYKDEFGVINFVDRRDIDLLNSRTGTNDVKYKAKAFSAQSAVNTLSASKATFKMLDGRDPKFGYRVIKLFSDPPEIVEVWVDNLHYNNALGNYYQTNQADYDAALAIASNAAFKAIRNEQYRVSGPVFLAELKKTIEMIKKPAKSLEKGVAGYFNALERRKRALGRPSNASLANKGLGYKANLKEILADTWLEYSFGWSPLVADIKGAAESLSKFHNDFRRSRVSSIGVSQATHRDVTVLAGFGGVAYKRRLWEIGEHRITFKVGLNSLLGGPAGSADRLRQNFGFKLAEFVPTAWEIVPWSFLVDYFVNINDVLSSTYTDTSDVFFVSRSDFQSVSKFETYTVNELGMQANYGGRYVGVAYPGGATSVRSDSSVVRQSGGLNPVMLQFKLPGSKTQLVNMAALAASRAKLRPYY